MNDFRRDISNGKSSASVNKTAPRPAQGAKLVKYENGKFTVTDPLGIKVRNAPSTKATHTGDLEKGDSIIYDRVYEGGGYRWLSYVSYSGARLYVPYRPSDDINNQWGTFSSAETKTDVKFIKNENGTFTANTTINVRSAPNTSADIVAQYKSGQSVNYDKVYEADGHRWISYISHSGERRYMAYRTLANPKVQWGTFS